MNISPVPGNLLGTSFKLFDLILKKDEKQAGIIFHSTDKEPEAQTDYSTLLSHIICKWQGMDHKPRQSILKHGHPPTRFT